MAKGIYKHRKGWKHTEETKRKMSETHKKIGTGKWIMGKYNGGRGVNHYRWNLNREKVMNNLRNDGEYKQWVKKVKKRNNNICQLKDENCSGYCIVHHILSWQDYPELRYNINNGITLCQAHHPRKRVDEKRLIPVFEKLVNSQTN